MKYGLIPNIINGETSNFVFKCDDEEVNICLECPIPKCKSPDICKRYKEELAKLRERLKRKRKKTNVKVV